MDPSSGQKSVGRQVSSASCSLYQANTTGASRLTSTANPFLTAMMFFIEVCRLQYQIRDRIQVQSWGNGSLQVLNRIMQRMARKDSGSVVGGLVAQRFWIWVCVWIQHQWSPLAALELSSTTSSVRITPACPTYSQPSSGFDIDCAADC